MIGALKPPQDILRSTHRKRQVKARNQHRFGVSQPLSLGVEEELLLVDGDGALTCAAEDVLESVAGTPIADRVSVEIFTEQIELKTGICHDADEVLEQLRELRRSVGQAGFGLLGCGLHPTAEGEPLLIAKPRYEVVQKDLGSLLKTPPCGLHVHVGMPDPEAAVRLTNALRLYLPALQALSANSPFQEGVDSGHASARTQVVRSYPRFQVPRAFRDYADFLEVADQLVAAAGVDDYTYIWWDVRPHPSLGTVEVRAVDVPTEPRTSAAFAALIQAIAAKELDRPTDSRLHREALEESYFQAASHGLEAEILFDSEQPGQARGVAAHMLETVRPYARELGGEEVAGPNRAHPARGQRSRGAAPGRAPGWHRGIARSFDRVQRRPSSNQRACAPSCSKTTISSVGAFSRAFWAAWIGSGSPTSPVASMPFARSSSTSARAGPLLPPLAHRYRPACAGRHSPRPRGLPPAGRPRCLDRGVHQGGARAVTPVPADRR